MPNEFLQGVISIDFDTGDIGTGSYSSTFFVDVSGTLGLYDSSCKYYNITFNGFSTVFLVLGIGEATCVITKTSYPVLFIGWLSG